MNSPFTAPAKPVNPVSEKQRDFLLSLAEQKAQLAGTEFNHDKAVEFIDSISKSEASEHIDRLKSEIGDLKRQAYQTDAITDIDGFWELPDGRIVKVQIAVNGSGNPYAKLMNEISGQFIYTPGLIAEVRKNGTRLPLDRAKALGKLYGICICCGRTLTDEYSIENGIGPICMAKF